MPRLWSRNYSRSTRSAGKCIFNSTDYRRQIKRFIAVALPVKHQFVLAVRSVDVLAIAKQIQRAVPISLTVRILGQFFYLGCSQVSITSILRSVAKRNFARKRESANQNPKAVELGSDQTVTVGRS